MERHPEEIVTTATVEFRWPRMYCPLPDFISRGDDGCILALTRGHRIEIGADGSLRIISKLTGQTEFEK